jgi:hypothetical protein
MQSLRGLSSDGTSTTAFEMLFSDFEESHCGFMMVEVKESGWEQRQTRHACALHLFMVRGAGRQTGPANIRLVRRMPVDRVKATGACTTTSNPHIRNMKTLSLILKAFSPPYLNVVMVQTVAGPGPLPPVFGTSALLEKALKKTVTPNAALDFWSIIITEMW